VSDSLLGHNANSHLRESAFGHVQVNTWSEPSQIITGWSLTRGPSYSCAEIGMATAPYGGPTGAAPQL
jgi:hypothetical protein